MRPYWVKKVVPYENQITILLYKEIQYSNGKTNYIKVANKKSFNELKKDGAIGIDVKQVTQFSSDSWFSNEDIVSKV